MANTFDEIQNGQYTSNNRKKKKKYESSFDAIQDGSYEYKPYISSGNKDSGQTSLFADGYDFGDITKTGLNILSDAFNKNNRFQDGYQVGDVTKTLLGTAKDIEKNLKKGAASTIEGAADWGINIFSGLFDEDTAQSMREFAQKDIAGELSRLDIGSTFGGFYRASDLIESKDFASLNPFDKEAQARYEERIQRDSLSGDTADQLAQGLGQLGGQVALQSLGIPWQFTAFTSSAGNEMNNAFQNNATYGQAFVSGLISGAVEVGTEYLGGGANKFLGMTSLGSKAIEKLGGKISNKLVAMLTKAGLDMAGEGLEEVLSGYGTAIGQKLTYMTDKEINELYSSDEALEEFISGALVSGIANIPGSVQTVKRGANAFTGMTDNEQKVYDKLVEERTKEAQENSKKKLTNKQIEAIENDVMKELTKGRVGVDYIEDALGYGDRVNYLVNEAENSLARELNEDELIDIQNQAREDILSTMNNDSLLHESYLQDQLRKTQYEIDLNKVDEKLKDFYQKVVDSGVLNNSRDTHNFVDLLAKIYKDKGIAFDFTNNEKLKDSGFAVKDRTVNAFVNNNNDVTLNINSNKALESVVGHEITHVLEGTDTYNALKESLKEYVESTGQKYEDLLKQTEGTYTDENGNTLGDVEKELTADLVGDYLFTNQEFINHLTQNRNLFQKIYDEIKYLVKQVTAGSKEERKLNKAIKMFEKAYRENSVKLAEQENTKYSITKDNGIQAINDYINSNNYVFNNNGVLTVNNLNDKQIKDLVKIYHTTGYEDVSTDYLVNRLKEGNMPLQREIADRFIEKELGYKPTIDTTQIFEDAEGNPLTKEQVEFYKDSGVRDIRGRLIPVYHRTNADFTVFDEKVGTQHGKKYGKGFYFSTTPENYGNNTMKVYLNAKDGEFKYVPKMGYYIVQEPNMIKNVDNKAPTDNPDIRYSLSTEDNKGRNLNYNQQEFYKYVSPKLKDENGNLKTYYHGTERADRVGTVFDPDRATSGPMAFFTDNEAIAEGYADSKKDTSLSREYDTEYDLFKANNMKLDDYWNSLTQEQKDEINRKGYNIGLDEDLENAVYYENASRDTFSDMYDYYLKNRENNNGLKALYDLFVEDGNFLFEDMTKFQDVLKLAGVENIDYLDPYKVDKKVYEVYLNITNPFDTADISNDIVNQLEEVANNEPENINSYSADMWDKTNRNPKEWMNSLKEDIKEGTTHSWTSIPDWVTDVLKSNGYDGIVDTGGKNGGQPHQVAIPFYSNQVKDVNNLNPTNNVDINLSLSQQDEIAPTRQPGLTYGEDIAYQEDIAPTGIDYTIDRDIMDLFHQEIARKGGKKVQLTKPVIAKEKSIFRKSMDTLSTMFVNQNTEIDNLAKESGNKNIKFAGDMLNNYSAEAQNDVAVAQTDNYGNAIGKSVQQLFEPAKAKGLEATFNDYLINYSNIDRWARGKGSQTPVDVSERLVKNYEEQHPEFKKWAKDIWKYGENVRKNWLEAGMIKQSMYDLLSEAYPHYVPYISDTNNFDAAMDKLNELKARPIKRAVGGATELFPVEEALTRYTFAQKRAYRQNELFKQIYNTLQTNPGQRGADVGEGYFTGEEPNLYRDDSGNYITALFDGEEHKIQVSDDLFKSLRNDMQTQIKDLENKLSIITKPLQSASKLRRKMLTSWSPSFTITNPLKDIQDAFFNSKHLKGMAKNYIPGIKELWTGSTPEARQFLALYGEGNLMGQFENESGLYDAKKGNKNNKFLKGLSKVNNIMELAPRYAEFKASLQAGESLAESMYNAREITTNFSRGGVITKALNRNGFTFLNASVQGFDKFIRNFSGENGARGIASSLLRAVMLGIAPAVFNELAFGGGDDKDEDYDALPDYIKDNYYLIKTGDGTFVRIPKGRMLSVFGSAARRTIELAEGEENAFEGYLSNVNNQIGINNPEENNIFSPLLQAYGSENGTAWYGGDIVPTRLQDKPKGEQYDASTDKMSIWLGEHLGISPYKFNYVLDQYTGGIGDIILPMITDEATSNGSLLAPVVDKFTADSTTDNKYVSDFYTKNDELKVKANSSKATDSDLVKNQYMYSVSKEMSQLYAERRNIQADNSLSKSEKYEKSQAIKDQINKLAKYGLDNYEKPIVTSNYASVGDYDYYKNAKGKWTEVSEKDEENINSLGLTNQEKSSYFKTSNDLYNIDQKYKGQTGTEASNNKKVDIINSIKKANLPDTAKAKLYDKKYASTETLNAVIDCGIDFNSYLDLQAQNFTADKDRYGKTINGSKKNKVYNYINNLDMPYEQKIMLAKLEYKSDDTYNREIINYLNNDNSISYQDMTEILKAMGFKVDEYGNITWE